MVLDGCPTAIFWSDTKKFEVFDNKDEQLQQGLNSENFYSFLYDSALVSRKPSRLFVSYRDEHSGENQIAYISKNCTVGEFTEFLASVSSLSFIDIPTFDTDLIAFSIVALVASYYYKSVSLFVLCVACAVMSYVYTRAETTDAVTYRYRMAKLALHPLKMNDAL